MKAKLKKIVRYAVPVCVKKSVKYHYYSALDLVDKCTGKFDPAYPPRRLNFVGSADFRNVGNEFVEHFKDVSHLGSQESVLDIGSGIGRIAIPLTKHLDPSSRYEGFDIDKRGVEWCQRNISPKCPNFQFTYVDIFNKYYNKHGTIAAREFVFPYEDNSFDFAFATSVFTHMLEQDVLQYLSELKRVLKPGGRYFITFFLLNDAVSARMAAGKTTASFVHKDPDCADAFYSHRDVKEAEIAYNQAWVEEALKAHGLSTNMQIHSGWWSGESGLSYQDVITGVKA